MDVLNFIFTLLSQITGSFILDGFPRNLYQAERIHAEYGLDLAVLFTLPYDILLKKTLGRRVCENQKCGANFNVEDINDIDRGIRMPSLSPKIENVCDVCGGPLTKRSDDTFLYLKI